MSKQGVSIHLEPDDTFRPRFFPVHETVGVFPDHEIVKSVGCAVYLGDVGVFFKSPAQLCEAVTALRDASDTWQSELFHAAQMGDGYVIAPDDTPMSHRDDLADAGIDRDED